jgi:RNA polymerase sigma-70 factor, ECF subfamily
VSKVFLALWQQAGSFKWHSQVSTWILAIARYAALSALRSRSDEPLDEDAAAAIVDPTEDASDAGPSGPQRDRPQMPVAPFGHPSGGLDLVCYHDKSVDEVIQIVGVPASTVKTRVFDARRQMESCSRRPESVCISTLPSLLGLMRKGREPVPSRRTSAATARSAAYRLD